jgi:hypothetical protein
MHRVQFSLEENEYASVKKRAKELGFSVEEFVRRAVRQALPAAGEGHWMRYAGFIESGDPYSSQSIDDLVCGDKD